jgi:ribose transport system permease protein
MRIVAIQRIAGVPMLAWILILVYVVFAFVLNKTPFGRHLIMIANLGIGMLFQAFAAVVIGGVSLRGGYGRLSGVFAGVLLLSSIQTAINVMGMPPHYTMVIQGTMVLVAVLLDTLKTTIRKRYL